MAAEVNDEPIELFVVSQDELAAKRHVFNAVKGIHYSSERVFLDRKEAELFCLRANAKSLESLAIQHWQNQRDFVWSVTFEADSTW